MQKQGAEEIDDITELVITVQNVEHQVHTADASVQEWMHTTISVCAYTSVCANICAFI